MGARMDIGDGIRKKLDDARLRTAMKNAVKKVMNELQDACVMKAPIITGNLRRSHSHEVLLSDTLIEGILKNNANYWVYVQFGTSKRKAKPFVTEAIQQVNPNQKIAQYFKENYKH